VQPPNEFSLFTVPTSLQSMNSHQIHPLGYHVWGAMLQAFHKLHSKPKDHSGAKKCNAADLGWLSADND